MLYIYTINNNKPVTMTIEQKIAQAEILIAETLEHANDYLLKKEEAKKERHRTGKTQWMVVVGQHNIAVRIDAEGQLQAMAGEIWTTTKPFDAKMTARTMRNGNGEVGKAVALEYYYRKCHEESMGVVEIVQKGLDLMRNPYAVVYEAPASMDVKRCFKNKKDLMAWLDENDVFCDQIAVKGQTILSYEEL